MRNGHDIHSRLRVCVAEGARIDWPLLTPKLLHYWAVSNRMKQQPLSVHVLSSGRISSAMDASCLHVNVSTRRFTSCSDIDVRMPLSRIRMLYTVPRR